MGEDAVWGSDIVMAVHNGNLHLIQKLCVCLWNNINNVDTKTSHTLESMTLKCIICTSLKVKKIYLSLWQSSLFYSLWEICILMFFLLGIKHRKFKENVQSQTHTFRTHFLTSYYMMDRVYFSLKTKWYTVDKGKKNHSGWSWL